MGGLAEDAVERGQPLASGSGTDAESATAMTDLAGHRSAGITRRAGQDAAKRVLDVFGSLAGDHPALASARRAVGHGAVDVGRSGVVPAGASWPWQADVHADEIPDHVRQ